MHALPLYLATGAAAAGQLSCPESINRARRTGRAHRAGNGAAPPAVNEHASRPAHLISPTSGLTNTDGESYIAGGPVIHIASVAGARRRAAAAHSAHSHHASLSRASSAARRVICPRGRGRPAGLPARPTRSAAIDQRDLSSSRRHCLPRTHLKAITPRPLRFEGRAPPLGADRPRRPQMNPTAADRKWRPLCGRIARHNGGGRKSAPRRRRPLTAVFVLAVVSGPRRVR